LANFLSETDRSVSRRAGFILSSSRSVTGYPANYIHGCVKQRTKKKESSSTECRVCCWFLADLPSTFCIHRSRGHPRVLLLIVFVSPVFVNLVQRRPPMLSRSSSVVSYTVVWGRNRSSRSRVQLCVRTVYSSSQIYYFVDLFSSWCLISAIFPRKKKWYYLQWVFL
jgi:hypothetical protein